MTPNATLERAIDSAAQDLAAGALAAATARAEAAVAQWPGDPRAHHLMGRVRLAEGRAKLALASFRTALAGDPTCALFWQDFSACLPLITPLHLDIGLLTDIAACLDHDLIDATGAEMTAATILIAQFDAFAATGQALSPSALSTWRRTPIGQALYDMLLAYLVRFRTKHSVMEIALTQLRKTAMLTAATQPAFVELNLAAALAVHCFNDEYVFAETLPEQAEMGRLWDLIRDDLHRGAAPAALNVALVAAYRPLQSMPDAAALLARCSPTAKGVFQTVLRVQLAEPLEERALKTAMPKLGMVEDDVSRDVQAQYEENPYPRWTRLTVRQSWPSLSVARVGGKILVAGSGTGHEPLRTAVETPNAEIWALDLSAASLAHAQRKAREYGITNVRFIQGDILNVAQIGEVFDLIICSGVLHHMRDPEAGLSALTHVLAKEGVMELALYTESGRKAVVAGIALRETLGLSATAEDMRLFREAVYALPAEHPARGLIGFRDFFSLSECRDLVFHVQEHRYTLPQIDAMLRRNGLVLDVFDVDYKTKAQLRASQSDPDAEKSLSAWSQLEDASPGIYGSMYQFSVRHAPQ